MGIRANAIACFVLTQFFGAAIGQEVQIESRAPGYSVQQIKQAVEIFRQNCQPLGGKSWSDLTDIKAIAQPETAPYRAQKGWSTSVLITAKIPDHPRLIPESAKETGAISGSTLFFILGGGNSPGFFVSKRVGQYLCGLNPPFNGDDRFVSVPALSILSDGATQ